MWNCLSNFLIALAEQVGQPASLILAQLGGADLLKLGVDVTVVGDLGEHDTESFECLWAGLLLARDGTQDDGQLLKALVVGTHDHLWSLH